ncbi:DNA-binding protein [Paraburkholderia strydomiana]|uniref:DNA-binding protein n=1 Tax=Paraburkholderia strydomiana TaxID=1245417 RepID=UPI0038BC5D50
MRINTTQRRAERQYGDTQMNIKTLMASCKACQLLSTEELAAQLSLQPQSIRKRYCQTGAYYSLRPMKLPNGRLMWPADSIERLVEAE